MRAVPAVFLIASACVRPAEDRALADETIGFGSAGDVEFEISRGHIRQLKRGTLGLWAQAPSLEIRASGGPDAVSPWTVKIENCMPEAGASATDGAGNPAHVAVLSSPQPTVCRLRFEIPPSGAVDVTVAPPDAGDPEPYAFAFMADIQQGLPHVDDVFERINADPELRFVAAAGDFVQNATRDEYELLAEKLEMLDIPYFATMGNHELKGDETLWGEFFGRYTIHFDFKGAAFSFVDSGNASIDPLVYDRLEGWLADAGEQLHIFATHYPPIDPVGLRGGSFRSRSEAYKLLALLADEGVDLALYGHLHSYYAYSNAGIPAYISGGGGAFADQLDGIGRHFLKVELDPEAGEVIDVALVRVD
jgi:3',5'-cyclic-AMP phosphodiesterase